MVQFDKMKKQAEAEVVPSSSLVEVEVGDEVWVEVGGVGFGAGLTFSVGWVGVWRLGE